MGYKIRLEQITLIFTDFVLRLSYMPINSLGLVIRRAGNHKLEIDSPKSLN